MSLNYGRIAVLMGGPSLEREISLRSGIAVYTALKERGHHVTAIQIPNTTVAQLYSYIISGLSQIDIAFIAMHGAFGEDGTIQYILEQLGIPYVGSDIEASRLGMDKVASRELFKKAGLNVPQYEVINKQNGLKFTHYPLVVKPASQGSSIGLSIVEHDTDLRAAIQTAFKFDKRVIVEEYIEGRELTVGILGEEPLPVIEIVPKDKLFSFECKYKQGMTDYLVPAPIDEDIALLAQKSALTAHNAIGARHLSRVDMIWKDNDVFILEINTIPGFTSTSLFPKAAKQAGLEFADLCEKLLELAVNYAQTAQGSAT